MPSYYSVGEIETIEYIKAKLNRDEYKGFLKGNVLKYISRSLYKGCESDDYKKASYYIKKLEELIEEDF